MSEACFYELARSMIKTFEKEFNLIKKLRNREDKMLVELVPRIAHATEYLAKALMCALATNKKACKEMQKHHDVSKLPTKVCSNSSIPLDQREVKAIAGVAILNAMFCNKVMWSIVRYGVESLGTRFPEATQKSVVGFRGLGECP